MNRLFMLLLSGVLFFAPWAMHNSHAESPLVLHTLAGEEVRLADYSGKVVVINFWATWCPPCLREIPDLIETQNFYEDRNVVVLGINIMDRVSPNDLVKFVKNHGITYPILVDGPNTTMEFAQQLGGVFGLPTSLFINKDGKVAFAITGAISRTKLDDIIKQLL